MTSIHLRASLLVAAVAVTIAACDSDDTSATSPDAGGHDASVPDSRVNDTGAADGNVDAGPPPAGVYTVGGTVTGLQGTGLVLQNNDGDDLPIAKDGTFTFATKLAAFAKYSVSIKTQPTAPAQTCTVSGGSGTISSGNVTSVAITCAANSFTVGGTVSGLAGTGLVLQDNNGDDLAVNANGTFAFAKPVASGGDYAVTIKSQPKTPTQTCTVTNGAGKVGAANVTDVTIACTTNAYPIGGTVTGLVGSGLKLKLNGGAALAVSANGTFSFPAQVSSGATYTVTIDTQPSNPTQTCGLGGATGTVVSAAVTSVTVNCATNAFTIGGTASGVAGTGLVLQDNGGNDLSVTANGSFAFSAPVTAGQPYAVTIKTQPTSPSQTCVLTNASGTVATANITDVSLVCTTNAYAVGGSVTGLTGTGLVLQDNGGNDLAITSTGSFTFTTNVNSGSSYAVTVKTQPSSPSQTCTVTNGTGAITNAAITNVSVACVTNKYTVGGNVTGLAGAGLVLQDNSGDDLVVTANGGFTFATKVSSGGAYAVTVKTQPSSPSQNCVVSAGTGTVSNGNVVSVNVNCGTNSFAVGGTASGVVGTGLVLQNNGGDDLTVNQDGTFAFGTPVVSGGAYAVTVKTQPTNPSQVCVVSNGSGNVGGAAVGSVGVTCTTSSFNVGGTVSGLAGTGLVLQDNAGDDLTITANGTFTFNTKITSGGTYAVTVKTQPSGPTQTCAVTSDSGTVTSGDVTSVSVTCTTNTYSVGGSVSGLAGTGLVLQDNNADDLAVTANGTFTFNTKIASGSNYAVTVKTQPSSPAQVCTVSNASGTITAAAVTNVSIVCTTTTHKVGGTLSGISGGTLVLQDNGADNLSLTANGSFQFATGLVPGATYAVTVLTQPSGQFCSVTNGSGTMGAADIASVTVSCIATPTPTFFWLDAADSASLTLSGTNVTGWKDKSTAGSRDAALNGSVAPVYTTNATPNGKPAVFFQSGTGSRMSTPAVSSVAEMTIFIAYKMAVNPPSWACLFEQIHDTYFSIRKSETQQKLNFHIQNDNDNPVVPLVINTWTIVTAIRQGATSTVYTRGNTAASYTGDTLTPNQSAALYVGSSAANESSNSYIAEIQAFSSALTAQQRTNIETALAAKYGIP